MHFLTQRPIFIKMHFRSIIVYIHVYSLPASSLPLLAHRCVFRPCSGVEPVAEPFHGFACVRVCPSANRSCRPFASSADLRYEYWPVYRYVKMVCSKEIPKTRSEVITRTITQLVLHKAYMQTYMLCVYIFLLFSKRNISQNWLSRHRVT